MQTELMVQFLNKSIIIAVTFIKSVELNFASNCEDRPVGVIDIEGKCTQEAGGTRMRLNVTLQM